ncbi:MAG: hypothetical protein ACK4NY_20290 [Spirosomataceae bacterium]
MKKLIKASVLFLVLASTSSIFAQSPIGKWKVESYWSNEHKFDSHKALLNSRPCAADIFYEITEDGKYRLNASKSNCDEKYKKMQEKIWSQTKWRLKDKLIQLSATNFSITQDYTITFSGNKMIWKNEWDTITYVRIN